MEDASKRDRPAEKKQWRDRMRDLRRALPEESHRSRSRLACRRLNGLFEVLGADSVGVYAAADGEIDLAWLWESGAGGRRTFFFPRVSGKNLTFHTPQDPRTDLRPGAFGIFAPFPDAPSITPSALEFIVAPGLSFDVRGNRVGSGAGFYDRLLGPLRDRPRLVGVGFSFQLLWDRVLPSEPSDVLMDWVVTDREAVRCLPGE